MFGRIRSLGPGLRPTALALVLGGAALYAPTGAAAHAGPPPTNDTFDAATQISFLPFEDGFVENSFASVDEGELDASCTRAIDATVWYRIDPTSNYGLRVRVLPESNNIDVILAVYTGSSLDSLSPLGCVDNSGANGRETLDVPVWAGGTFFIQVGGWDSQNTYGGFTVRVKRAPAPANDNLANATIVALGSVSYATTTLATLQSGEPAPSCAPSIDRTLWYRYTPSRTRTIVANSIGSNFDTVVAVYSGSSLGTLTEVTCNDDRGVDTLSKVRISVLGGVTYYFQVGGYAGSFGDLVFNLKAT